MRGNVSVSRQGVTLIELLVGIVVLAVLAGAMTLRPWTFKQTAKNEAEKIAAVLRARTTEASRKGRGFTLTILGNASLMADGNEIYKVTDGFYISWNAPGGELEYSIKNSSFTQGATIDVKGERGDWYFVPIAVIEGRIRTSPTHP